MTKFHAEQRSTAGRLAHLINCSYKSCHVQVLHEAEQIFADGRRRRRGIPLSEKLLPGESAEEAARRGMIEELGSAITSTSILSVGATAAPETTTERSQSYPALRSQVRHTSFSEVRQ